MFQRVPVHYTVCGDMMVSYFYYHHFKNFKKNLPFSTFYDIILQAPVKWRNGKIDLSNDDISN